jgi:hypothetical protein
MPAASVAALALLSPLLRSVSGDAAARLWLGGLALITTGLGLVASLPADQTWTALVSEGTLGSPSRFAPAVWLGVAGILSAWAALCLALPSGRQDAAWLRRAALLRALAAAPLVVLASRLAEVSATSLGAGCAPLRTLAWGLALTMLVAALAGLRAHNLERWTALLWVALASAAGLSVTAQRPALPAAPSLILLAAVAAPVLLVSLRHAAALAGARPAAPRNLLSSPHAAVPTTLLLLVCLGLPPGAGLTAWVDLLRTTAAAEGLPLVVLVAASFAALWSGALARLGTALGGPALLQDPAPLPRAARPALMGLWALVILVSLHTWGYPSRLARLAAQAFGINGP